jgi:hypothetical protein
MSDYVDNIYKTSAKGKNIKEEIQDDLESNMTKFNDPIVLGELMYKLLEERENTNRILKNILSKLEKLDNTPLNLPQNQPPLLPAIDEQIMEFVRAKGKVIAEDVRKEFKYKGKNAASARLNKLYELGLIEKKQVGKKMFFLPI